MQNKHGLRAGCLVLFLLFLLLMESSAFGQSHQKSVLILHSYHPGYKWTDEIHDGIMKTLIPYSDQLALYVEYLDMKRAYSEEKYQQASNWIADKYSDQKFDLIITSDDTAMIFLKRYGERIFSGVPVLFCGTNYLEEQDLAGLDDYYGITEKADIAPTFQAILDLLPKTKKIYVINDRTVTGRQVNKEISSVINTFKSQVEIEVWDDLTMDELLVRVSDLPDDTVLFYTFFFRDKSGRSFEYKDSIEQIAAQSNRPIFGAWDFNLDHGIVGGMLTSGREQGKAVGQMALDWLNGKPLTELPKVTSSPNKFMFDYAVMHKFGIPVTALPEDVEIIHRPESFYERHKKVVLVSAAVTVFLITVIIILLFNIQKRKRAEKELRQSEKNYREIFNNTREGLFQSSKEGKLLRINPAFAKIMKCASPEDAIAYYEDLRTQFYSTPDDRDIFIQHHDDYGWTKTEIKAKAKDGSEVDIFVSSHSVHNENGDFLYFEGSVIDLTETKKTQELIAQTDKVLSLGGVSAGIAHEVRSPLSVISFGCDIVHDRLTEDNDKNRKVADEVGVELEKVFQYAEKRKLATTAVNMKQAAIRANDIMKDMLSYSKNAIDDFEPASLVDIIEKALVLARRDRSFNREINFADIEIVKEIEDIPQIVCSASKIQQVIFNILHNGIQAMAEAGVTQPRFVLRLIKVEDMVQLEIEDNGPGMAKEVQEKIFQPFFTTKEREKGTGLGLSVSSFIIKENHSGELELVSAPGDGCTFIIKLPLDAAAVVRSEEECKASGFSQ